MFLRPLLKSFAFKGSVVSLICLLSSAVVGMADVPDDGVEAVEQADNLPQSQATLASLFGRGAKMPDIPRIEGTVALPSFDSSEMRIDEAALIAAQREESAAEDQGQRS